MRDRNIRFVGVAALHNTAVVGVIAAAHHGLLGHIWASDPTGITALIGLLYLVGVMRGLYRSYKDYSLFPCEEEPSALLASICLGLGLLGTIIGFALMLGHIPNVNPNNVAQTRMALDGVALGMRTALYTTGVGLVAQMILSVQVFILSWGPDAADYDEE